MLCSRMSYLVLWNTCRKLSRSQILEVAVYKTLNLFAIAQVTFSVVCIMLSTFFPFVSFFEPFPFLLLITVISIPIFSSCNTLPSSLLPHIIHLFSSDSCRTLRNSCISSSIGWVSRASATFQPHHRKTITYLSLPLSS